MARIVEIAGRQWVAGMSWRSFEDTPNKDDIREDADSLKSDWYAVRISESAIQAGFCAPITGIKRPAKLYSLAAMLADSREQPWLGIFKVGDGLWWYIAVRDHHAILPDGDVIGGEEEIHAARDRHSGYTDWKYIEGELDMLAEFMGEIDEKPTPVKSLTASNIPVVPLVAAVTTISLLAGGALWWHYRQVAEERERAIAMAKMREQLAAQKPPVVIPPSPLLTSPAPNHWLAACRQVITHLPISRFGWLIQDTGCNQTSVVITWIRQDGATVAQRPAGDVSADGDKIIETIAMPDLVQKGDDNAVALESAKLTMRAWAQRAGIPLTLSAPPAPVVLPGASAADASKTNLPPPIPQSAIHFDTPVAPFAFDLSAIPGLRLTSLKTTQTGWSVEGTLYGRR